MLLSFQAGFNWFGLKPNPLINRKRSMYHNPIFNQNRNLKRDLIFFTSHTHTHTHTHTHQKKSFKKDYKSVFQVLFSLEFFGPVRSLSLSLPLSLSRACVTERERESERERVTESSQVLTNQQFPVHVKRSVLDSEQSFVAVRRTARTRFAE